ncbi:MAG: MliC family protein [Nitrospiraceae bacterium]
MMMMNHLTLAGSLVAGLIGTVYAADPSFDCRQVKPSSIESVICGSPQLSSLDREMVRLYKLATGPASGASVEEAKQEHMVWLKEYNQCARIQAQELCMRNRYLKRIARLRLSSKAARGADDKGISIGPVVYQCEKTDGMVIATFVKADPPVAYVTRKDTWVTMERVPSGSGAKYQGDSAQSFWEHQGEALYREGDEVPEVKCKHEPMG